MSGDKIQSLTGKRNTTCFASCEHPPGPDFFERIPEYQKLIFTKGIVQVVVQELKKKKSFESLFDSVLSPILQLSSHCPSLLCRNYRRGHPRHKEHRVAAIYNTVRRILSITPERCHWQEANLNGKGTTRQQLARWRRCLRLAISAARQYGGGES